MSVLLQAENVTVAFGSLIAVREVSFELSGGQLLGLIGPNGAGKTTLLRVCTGLHAPTHGAARVMGRPVLGEHDVVRRHVGFAPDTPPAYDELTIEQFLRFIAGAYRIERPDASERIDFWLDQLWLQEKRHTLIKELSKGMRQRVTLARAFIPNPHVILLDEPLGGLDPAGRKQLRGVLGMLRDQGCAMIVSSHILSDLEEVATDIAIIEQGRIIRWQGADELHHEQLQRRTYRVRVLHGAADCAAMIESLDGVSDLRTENHTITFDYHADPRESAALLKRLVTGGVDVVSFDMVRVSLEETYLRAGVKQVD
jgi:ABC-2 type transport system ATP-binding protein